MADIAFSENVTASIPSDMMAVTSQFVTFTCGDRAFGVDIMSVREIRSWSPTLELPRQPHGATGVMDIRGNVVQVYDLALMIGMQSMARDPGIGQVVLVVSINDWEVGVLVDAVSDITSANSTNLRPVPAADGEGGPDLASGLVKIESRLIAVLDLDALFPAACRKNRRLRQVPTRLSTLPSS